MKIAVISKYGLSPSSGQNNRIFEICQSFLEISDVYNITLISSISCGYQYDLSAYDSKFYYYESNIDGIKHILLKGPIISLGFNFKRILSWIIFELFLFFYLSHRKFNILWVSSLSLLTILNGIFFKKIFNSKLIFEVRDIWPQSIIEISNRKSGFTHLLSKIELFGYVKTDFIVSPLFNFSEYLEKLNPEFKKKFHYIAQNISSSYELPRPISNSNKLGICYAGSFGKANSIEQFLKLVSNYKIDEKIVFFFIGKGIDFKRLKSVYSNSQYIFKDYMHSEDLQLFLRKNCNIGIQFIPNRSIYQYGISPNKWNSYHKSGLAIFTFSFLKNDLLTQYNAGINFEFNEKGIIMFIKKLHSNVIDTEKYHSNFSFLAKEKFSLKKDLNQFIHLMSTNI
jgi:hypothetical protein